VADSRTFLPLAPWAGLFPIVFLSSLIIGINMLADALAKTLGVDRAQKAPI
jgi:peptide/nickel transport system permease protein